MEQKKCENAEDTMQNKRRQEHTQYAYIFVKRFCDEFDLCRSFLNFQMRNSYMRRRFLLSQFLFVIAFYRIVYILTEF
ncbi:conserved hypothetical protein [Trichinella spiralis]|uniref:hypothetical protein n=1 Tax=Trichinella spiralis TaxID=6334 RepID=UPI0001EFDFA0|nr:conserved hypothetical protein [Trichinella spiralis]